MRSSILGKDFINYRMDTSDYERTSFSAVVRKIGEGKIPIVVDSVDEKLALSLASRDPSNKRNIRYGYELSMSMDDTILDLLKNIKVHLIRNNNNNENFNNIRIGLEDGTFPDLNIQIGDLYKLHRNKEDFILYVLVTRDKTVFQYIKSIISFLMKKIY